MGCRVRPVPRAPVGLLVLVLWLGMITPVSAAEGDFGSALLVGVGGAYSAAPADPAVVWFNPALLTFAENRGSFTLSYRRLYDLAALGEADAGIRQRLAPRSTIGAGFARFGQSGLFQETRGVVAVSQRVGRRWSLGTGIRYDRTEFGDDGEVFSGASLNLGLAGRPADDILVGVAVRRIRVDALYDGLADDPGAIVEATMAWSAPPDIVVAGIWSKEKGERARYGLGQRLRLVRDIEFLSGLRFDPISYSLGARIVFSGGTIDYVYQSHAELGGTHTIGIAWNW